MRYRLLLTVTLQPFRTHAPRLARPQVPPLGSLIWSRSPDATKNRHTFPGRRPSTALWKMGLRFEKACPLNWMKARAANQLEYAPLEGFGLPGLPMPTVHTCPPVSPTTSVSKIPSASVSARLGGATTG